MKFKSLIMLSILGLTMFSPISVHAEASVEAETTTERKLLDYKPDDLVVEFPDSFPLQLQADNSYIYNGIIHVKSDSKYFINISAKNSSVEYTSENGDSVIGTIELGDSELDSAEIITGVDVPITIKVENITSKGQFSTSIGFSIDIYQEQEVQPEAPPIIEEEVIETLELSSETVSAGDLEAYPHLKSITITKDVISIEASAFDSLSELTDIYYLGSEGAWSSVFVGNLDRIAIHFAEEDEVPEVEPTEPIVDPEVPEVEPTEPTEEEVTDPEVDPTQPADEDVTDETPTDEAPVDEEPTDETPEVDESITDETPKTDEDSTNETEIEEPSSEDTQSKEPSSEEPANEESTTEELSSEQPVSEEPIEEPAPEPLEEEVPEVSNEAESNGVDGVTE